MADNKSRQIKRALEILSGLGSPVIPPWRPSKSRSKHHPNPILHTNRPTSQITHCTFLCQGAIHHENIVRDLSQSWQTDFRTHSLKFSNPPWRSYACQICSRSKNSSYSKTGLKDKQNHPAFVNIFYNWNTVTHVSYYWPTVRNICSFDVMESQNP